MEQTNILDPAEPSGIGGLRQYPGALVRQTRMPTRDDHHKDTRKHDTTMFVGGGNGQPSAETLGDPYHKQVPLPSIPDYRAREATT